MILAKDNRPREPVQQLASKNLGCPKFHDRCLKSVWVQGAGIEGEARANFFEGHTMIRGLCSFGGSGIWAKYTFESKSQKTIILELWLLGLPRPVDMYGMRYNMLEQIFCKIAKERCDGMNWHHGHWMAMHQGYGGGKE